MTCRWCSPRVGLGGLGDAVQMPSGFARWFAGSKAVNADGRPWVLYHGMVGELAGGAFRASATGESGRGIYLSPSPDDAARWADNAARRLGAGGMRPAPVGQAVVPVYVRLTRPFEATFNVVDRPTLRHRIEDAEPSVGRLPAGTDTTAVLQALGYDGVIRRSWRGEIVEVVAFSPSQVKGLFNAGGWDSSKPDILDGLGDARRWAYHVTDHINLPSIAATGLEARTPDPEEQPPELYFGDEENVGGRVAPHLALLRFPWPRDAQDEGYGAFSSRKSVKPANVELRQGGRWVSLVGGGGVGLGALDTREAALERFRAAVAEVWGKAPAGMEIELAPDVPAGGLLAAVRFAGKPWAAGRHLVSYPRHVALLVSDAFLRLEDEKAWKVLLHEAVHLGYRGHGQDFRDVAREVGAVVSGSAVETGGEIRVQKKVGHRYQTVRTFTDEREAVAWGREQVRLEPGSRWRVEQ